MVVTDPAMAEELCSGDPQRRPEGAGEGWEWLFPRGCSDDPGDSDQIKKDLESLSQTGQTGIRDLEMGFSRWHKGAIWCDECSSLGIDLSWLKAQVGFRLLRITLPQRVQTFCALVRFTKDMRQGRMGDLVYKLFGQGALFPRATVGRGTSWHRIRKPKEPTTHLLQPPRFCA